MNTAYPIIGLEVHVQLKTKTKAFCSCQNKYGGSPNTRVCPTCMGMPGSYPKLNRELLNFGIMAGLATSCTINQDIQFDRKSYSYPDLPNGYQISQADKPLCTNGFITIEKEDTTTKQINIERIHMEEDAGKMIHLEDGTNNSYVDYNRAGTPLLETVSKPDIRSSEEAILYLKQLKEIYEYLEISDCNMEEGSLRCDVNISMMIPLEDGTIVNTPISEIKNLNSFSNIKKALDYEATRQVKEYYATKITNNGLNKSTLGFDDAKGITFFQRSKEEESDYRTIPEFTIPPLQISDELIEQNKNKLPELASTKRLRFVKEYAITEYDAVTLSADKNIAHYFEEICKDTKDYKKAANFLLTDIGAVLNMKEIGIKDFSVPPKEIAKLINYMSDNTISSWIAKSVFEKMQATGKSAEVIINEDGLRQMNNEDELINLVTRVLEENPKSIEDYKNGKDNALKFMMGQVMKLSKGKANPVRTTELFLEKLQ